MANNEVESGSEAQPIGQLLISIIDKPTSTFKAVVARRKWWMWAVPLLVFFVCFIILMVASAPIQLEMAQDQLERQLASMPADQAEAARAQAGQMVSMPVVLISGLVGGGIALIIGIVGQAALLYFGALIAGGEVDFGPVFTVSAWTRLPMALRSLVQAIFVAVSGRSPQMLGLPALAASGDMLEDARNPLVILLSQADLFWLWHLLLTVLGLAVVARFSRAKSVVLTVVYALLSLAVVVLPAVLFAGMAGG